MSTAAIADIHGNAHALEAVLASGQPRAEEVTKTLMHPPGPEEASVEFERTRTA